MRHILPLILLIMLLTACNLSADLPASQQTETITPLEEESTPTGDAPTFTPTMILTSTPVQTAIPPRASCIKRTEWQTHIIQAGDTLSQLAERANISLQVLMQANCIENANLIAVGQTLYVPNLLPSPQPPLPAPDGYLYHLPNDNQCYFNTFMIGSPFVVYSGANLQADKNPLPITIPDNVFIRASAKSEYRVRVHLPDNQQVWIDTIVGMLQGNCDAIQNVQTIAPPPDNRCYVRLDMHAPPPFYMNENRVEIDFIPTFTWLLVNARDRDAFHYQTYLRIVLDDGQQVWIPPMTPSILSRGACDNLPIGTLGIGG